MSYAWGQQSLAVPSEQAWPSTKLAVASSLLAENIVLLCKTWPCYLVPVPAGSGTLLSKLLSSPGCIGDCLLLTATWVMLERASLSPARPTVRTLPVLCPHRYHQGLPMSYLSERKYSCFLPLLEELKFFCQMVVMGDFICVSPNLFQYVRPQLDTMFMRKD